jgi:hypothetical protein
VERQGDGSVTCKNRRQGLHRSALCPCHNPSEAQKLSPHNWLGVRLELGAHAGSRFPPVPRPSTPPTPSAHPAPPAVHLVSDRLTAYIVALGLSLPRDRGRVPVRADGRLRVGEQLLGVCYLSTRREIWCALEVSRPGGDLLPDGQSGDGGPKLRPHCDHAVRDRGGQTSDPVLRDGR